MNKKAIPKAAKGGITPDWSSNVFNLQQSIDPYILLNTILDSSDDTIISTTLDGTITSWNAGARMMYGYSPEEVLGQSISIVIPPDKKDELQKIIESARQGKSIPELETIRITKDGIPVCVSINITPIKDAQKRIIGILGVTRNITRSKQAEEALRESEEKYRQLFELESDAILLIENETGQIIEANAAAASLYGYTREEVIHKKNTDLSAEPTETLRVTVQQIDQVPLRYHRKKDGTVFPVEITGRHFTWRGRLVHIAAIRDITERKRAEDALRESELTLTILMSNLPGMAYRCSNDRDWTMRFVSQGCLDLTGYQPEALIDNRTISYGALINPEDREMVWQEVQQALREKQSFHLHYRINTSVGVEKWVWEQGLGVFSENGDLLAIEGFITDVTERKLVENALMESHERFLTVINSIDANIYVADFNTYEILLINRRMKEDFGDDLEGKICWKSFRNEKGPCSICSNEKLVDKEGNPTGVYIWEGKNPVTGLWYMNYDRAIKWVDGRLVRLQISTDITDRKQMEERLQYLINHDPLTGLYNRFYFEEEIARLERSRQFPVSIIAIDIDGLKNVNDSKGHAAGDELLKQTATVLRASFRAEDVVARIGGDEFAVLLPKTTRQATKGALSRFRKCLRAHDRKFPGFPLKLSLGVATTNEHQPLIDVLMKADHRMYQDKVSK